MKLLDTSAWARKPVPIGRICEPLATSSALCEFYTLCTTKCGVGAPHLNSEDFQNTDFQETSNAAGGAAVREAAEVSDRQGGCRGIVMRVSKTGQYNGDTHNAPNVFFWKNLIIKISNPRPTYAQIEISFTWATLYKRSHRICKVGRTCVRLKSYSAWDYLLGEVS